jgi:hypothetical protein
MACMIARRHRTVARERSVNERFGRSFEPGGASGGVPIGSVPCSVTHVRRSTGCSAATTSPASVRSIGPRARSFDTNGLALVSSSTST